MKLPLKSISIRLRELAQRVKRNVPSRHDPERFHAEKSEIEDQLIGLSKQLNDR